MTHKDNFFSTKKTIQVKGRLIDISEPTVMGIINITPDSFYDASRVTGGQMVLNRVSQIVNEGGSFVDIGSYSSRPGAADVSEEEEKLRLAPVLKLVRGKYPNIIISVDTFRSEIASWAVNECGADIINDISAGEMDKNMFKTIAQLKVPYIIMHMRGTPQNMQANPEYKNAPKEVISELSEKVYALKNIGVNDIIIDPGFGFSKTIEHNYQILEKLEIFRIFELPLLVGVSRKSMIYKVLESTPEESLNGTSVLNTIALMKGANILRVHDVKEAVEAVKLVKKLNA
jgi:dihydropteroate synthase